MTYEIEERLLHFKQPAGTSRGVYTTRKIWLVYLSDGDKTGVGECAPLPDLSCDAGPDYREKLEFFCAEFCRWQESQRGQSLMCSAGFAHEGQSPCDSMRDYPSMLFGLETALLSLQSQELPAPEASQGDCPLCEEFPAPVGEGSGVGSIKLFNTAFSRGEEGIPINGLVWMGNYDEMLHRMEEKLKKGFRCVKLKIGAIDFEQELDLVKRIRDRFSFHEVELRLDANGAFPFEDALYKLELLSQYAIHSIEQPIRQGQWAYMAELCRESPLPIALDEELIGVNDPEMKAYMLNIIKPRYIILKPSLHGGMMGCREWIQIAKSQGIGSWITSALESNIGLNAIAQFASDVYGPHITMPQGLGTGQLFTDNIPMPLEIRGDQLWRCL